LIKNKGGKIENKKAMPQVSKVERINKTSHLSQERFRSKQTRTYDMPRMPR